MSNEQEIREDERQACWEDFIQVLRGAIRDAKTESASTDQLTALHEAVYLMGWKELGTGDGKPMHKLVNSAVNHWNMEQI